MLSLLWDLVLMIAVPVAIRHLLSFMSSRGKSSKPADASTEPVSAATPPIQRYLRWLLVSAAAWSVYTALLSSPVNLFDVVGAPYDCPNYILRNRFRAFLLTDGVESFPPIANPHILPRANPAEVMLDSASVSAADQGGNDNVLEWWTALFEQLKLSDNRQNYLHYGHQAYVDCYWCRSYQDYALYTASALMAPYLGVLALLGAVSYFIPSKRFWGYTLVWVIVCALSSDLFVLAMSHDYLNELMMLTAQDDSAIRQTSLFNLMRSGRHLLFGAMLALVWLIDRPVVKSEQQLLAEHLRSEEEFLATMKALQLQRMAVMDDEELLKRFVKYHRTRQAERAMLMQEPAVREVRERALNRINVSQAVQSLHRFHYRANAGGPSTSGGQML